MTWLGQSNLHKKTNRQRLLIEQTAVRYQPVTRLPTNDSTLKNLSFDVYTHKHLLNAAKPPCPTGRQKRYEQFFLPSIDKNLLRDETRAVKNKKRPSYRKSLFHPETSSTVVSQGFTELTTRGTRTELKVTLPMMTDDDSLQPIHRHYAPPPSPSDDEIERFLTELQEKTSPSRISSPPSSSSVDNEDYVPFRLPALQKSARVRHTPEQPPYKNIRSTLSNYLQKYYWCRFSSPVGLNGCARIDRSSWINMRKFAQRLSKPMFSFTYRFRRFPSIRRQPLKFCSSFQPFPFVEFLSRIIDLEQCRNSLSKFLFIVIRVSFQRRRKNWIRFQ